MPERTIIESKSKWKQNKKKKLSKASPYKVDVVSRLGEEDQEEVGGWVLAEEGVGWEGGWVGERFRFSAEEEQKKKKKKKKKKKEKEKDKKKQMNVRSSESMDHLLGPASPPLNHRRRPPPSLSAPAGPPPPPPAAGIPHQQTTERGDGRSSTANQRRRSFFACCCSCCSSSSYSSSHSNQSIDLLIRSIIVFGFVGGGQSFYWLQPWDSHLDRCTCSFHEGATFQVHSLPQHSEIGFLCFICSGSRDRCA